MNRSIWRFNCVLHAFSLCMTAKCAVDGIRLPGLLILVFLQVMYDATGVRLHAGQQAEVLPSMFIIVDFSVQDYAAHFSVIHFLKILV